MHAPQVNAVLADLLPQMQAILGAKLAGLYLYGSLVMGDFDIDYSDIDLLAALTEELAEAEFAALNTMHHGLVATHAQWQNRLEIAYLSLRGLRTFKTETSRLAIISPGEPFHFKPAGKDWLMNWYLVREHGVVLFGPPPQSLIAPVTLAEFIQAVRDHALSWGEWIEDVQSRPAQAYVILTLCRTLYTIAQGEQPSKPQAARWAAQVFPAWSTLIENALVWRRAGDEEQVDPAATLAETRRFVAFVSACLAPPVGTDPRVCPP